MTRVYLGAQADYPDDFDSFAECRTCRSVIQPAVAIVCTPDEYDSILQLVQRSGEGDLIGRWKDVADGRIECSGADFHEPR